MNPSIRAVAVAIPARNEEQRIERCLQSVLRGASQDSLPTAIAVVADRCTDATAELARAVLSHAPTGIHTVVWESRAGSAGAARELAARVAVAALPGSPETWLTTTDADTVVPRSWIHTQLRWAAQGCDAVAGLVRLDPRDGCDRSLVHDYNRLIRQVGIGLGHPHVHGANLGLRASVWHAVGGFAPLTVGEDHDLWTRVVASGACALGVDDNHVVTSARRDGRAPGGFAALLESLDPG